MVWLVTHMWLLLLLAWLLGLLTGWWIWSRREQQDQEGEVHRAEATTVSTPQSVAAMPAADPTPEPEQEPERPPVRVAAEPPAATAPTPPERVAPVALTDTPNDGTKPKLYDSPTEGPADDLKRISGIGPKYEKLLNSIGVWYYDQIASWNDDEINWLDQRLEFPGRIRRDNWQEQARVLGAGGTTEFAGRYEKGEVGSSYVAGDGMAKAERKITADDFLADIRKYDADADRDIIQRIVNYCGIALRSRDASLVACSDKAERDQVATGFCAKKLGMDREEADAAVLDICQQMKEDRNKKRVVFYYLLAKKAGKLHDL